MIVITECYTVPGTVLRTVLGYLIYFYINEWIDKCFDGWSKICSIYIYTYMKQVDELWINESMSKGKNKWQISGRMDRWIDKWTSVWMNSWINGWQVGEWIDGYMDELIVGWMKG